MKVPPLVPGTREFVFRAGGLALLRAMNRHAARIIAYHRFPDSSVETLRRQCEYLRKFHQVVSLDDIDRWLCGDLPLRPNSVAVTVDDGYRDFYRVAYPVFREYQIPVTVFLTTGFVDRVCWLWVDVVAFLFRGTSVAQAAVPLGKEVQRFRLESGGERTAAAAAVKEAAKRMDHDARCKLVYEELPASLQCAIPEFPPAEYEALRWDEIREMHRNGVRFGGHTETHPILSSIRSQNRLCSEIAGCKRKIEAELGHPVSQFAYPNGTFLDINPEVIDEVRRAGYKSAVLAEFGIVGGSADRFELRRNMTEPVTPMPFFGRTVLRSK